MAIHDVEQRAKFPIIGKIRLGMKKQSQSGAEYPTTVPYFVLHDAPDVAKAYGNEPTELDGMFLSNDIEQCIPYYYKWYAGGSKDKNGNIIGGKLVCKGDGRQADYFGQRDPITRIVPKRECKAQQCPDWVNSKGQPQCKQMLDVFMWIPLANLGGLYQITTTSWKSIDSFVKQVNMIKQISGGKLAGIPFKIIRVPVSTSFVDPKTNQEKRGTQYIMQLKYNPNFINEKGAALRTQIENLTGGQHALISQSDIDAATATSDHLMIGNAGAEVIDDDAVVEPDTAVVDSTTIAEDKELAPLFEELATNKGIKITPKTRLLTARKFEGQPNQKEQLKSYLEGEIAKSKPVAPPPAAATQSTQKPNADGLI